MSLLILYSQVLYRPRRRDILLCFRVLGRKKCVIITSTTDLQLIVISDHLDLAYCLKMRWASPSKRFFVVTYIFIPVIRLWTLMVLSSKFRYFKSPSWEPFLKIGIYHEMELLFASPYFVFIPTFRYCVLSSGLFSTIVSSF